MRLLSIFFFTVSLLFLGCEEKALYTKIDKNATIESGIENFTDLKKRYFKYWDLRSAAEYTQSYAYELPYLNLLKSQEWYEEFHMYDNKNYTTTMLYAKRDKNDGDIVHIRNNFKGKYIDTNVTEKWININGIWYHSYSQSLLPPKPKPII